MRNGDGAMALIAGHVARGHHGVDNRLFCCFCNCDKYRIKQVVGERFFNIGGVVIIHLRRGKRDKNIAGPVANVTSHAAQPQRRPARESF